MRLCSMQVLSLSNFFYPLSSPAYYSRHTMTRAGDQSGIFGNFRALFSYIGGEAVIEESFECLLWLQRFFSGFSGVLVRSVALLLPMGGPRLSLLVLIVSTDMDYSRELTGATFSELQPFVLGLGRTLCTAIQKARGTISRSEIACGLVLHLTPGRRAACWHWLRGIPGCNSCCR